MLKKISTRTVIVFITIFILCELMDIFMQNAALLAGDEINTDAALIWWYCINAPDLIFLVFDLSRMALLFFVLYGLLNVIITPKMKRVQELPVLVIGGAFFVFELIDVLAIAAANALGSYEINLHAGFFYWQRYAGLESAWFLDLSNVFAVFLVVTIGFGWVHKRFCVRQEGACPTPRH